MLKHCKHETQALLSVDQGAKFRKASIETTQLVFISQENSMVSREQFNLNNVM